MNILTLSSHYTLLTDNNVTLTATQLISLHLFLHRPPADGESSDPLFGPYISVLPQDFDNHPLTWAVHRDLGLPHDAGRILDVMPPAATNVLAGVKKRFWDDWRFICQVMVCCIYLFAYDLLQIFYHLFWLCRACYRRRCHNSPQRLLEHLLREVTWRMWRPH